MSQSPSHAIVRVVSASSIGILIALRGLKKGNLDASGAVAAAVVGSVSLASSLSLGSALLLFYYTGSSTTRLGKNRKKSVDFEATDGGGQRTWTQVLSTAGVGTLLAALYAIETNEHDLGALIDLSDASNSRRSALVLAYLGNFACVCGDTWASELGILAEAEPRMVTSPWFGLRVPRGTNGGVTVWGTAMSAAGGAFMGWVLFGVDALRGLRDPRFGKAAMRKQWMLVPLGCAAGLFGSWVDSVLGATVQRSYYQPSTGLATSKLPKDAVVDSELYSGANLERWERERESGKAGDDGAWIVVSGFEWLTNEQVNLASSMFTAGVSSWVGIGLWRWFGE
jgi:uncharacterized protein (TIGR00297 family)